MKKDIKKLTPAETIWNNFRAAELGKTPADTAKRWKNEIVFIKDLVETPNGFEFPKDKAGVQIIDQRSVYFDGKEKFYTCDGKTFDTPEAARDYIMAFPLGSF